LRRPPRQTAALAAPGTQTRAPRAKTTCTTHTRAPTSRSAWVPFAATRAACARRRPIRTVSVKVLCGLRLRRAAGWRVCRVLRAACMCAGARTAAAPARDEGSGRTRVDSTRAETGAIARRCSLSPPGGCKRLTRVDSYRRHLPQQQHARPPLRAGSVRRHAQHAWLHATLGRRRPGERRSRCRLARVHAAQGQTENTAALAAPARTCSSCRRGRSVRGGGRGKLLPRHATPAQGTG
jgi:hypothetical protein